MSAVWPVLGPLFEPANRSGVRGGFGRRCHCDPTLGHACPACTGDRADEWEQVKASRDADTARTRRMTDPRVRAAWLASLPPNTRALLDPTHRSEEATA